MDSRHGFKFVALLGIVCLLMVPSVSLGAVVISVRIAPPLLPVYVQPLCPGPDYLWMPGYWAWEPDGYFWVPGTWVLAPEPGLLWTPGYWGFVSGLYLWHPGYWGRHVGFYGGVDYGFGYFGAGFVGGEWAGDHFRYNTAVMHVDPALVHNTYIDRAVVRNAGGSRFSFNGPGGLAARPTAAEATAGHERHIGPTAVQTAHQRTAETNRSNFLSVNHGQPATMATSRPTAAAKPANTAKSPATNRFGNRSASGRVPSGANQSATRSLPGVNTPPGAANPGPRRSRPAQPSAAARPTAPVNHPGSSDSRSAPNRAESRPAPARAPAAANRPRVNAPQGEENRALSRPAPSPPPAANPPVNRSEGQRSRRAEPPAPVTRPAPPSRPAPARAQQLENRPAPPPRPQAAREPSPQPSAPARQAPGERGDEHHR